MTWRVYLAEDGKRHPRAGWSDVETVDAARNLAVVVVRHVNTGALRVVRAWNGKDDLRCYVRPRLEVVIERVRRRGL